MRRLIPPGGEIAKAAYSWNAVGFSGPSLSTRSAILYSASPRRLPAWPVVIMSLRDGGSVSPAIVQMKLPMLEWIHEVQKSCPLNRASPYIVAPCIGCPN